MTDSNRDKQFSQDDCDAPKSTIATILIKQRETLMERLKNINPEEISLPMSNGEIGKLFWDSPHWNSNWNSNWDSNWSSNRWDHKIKNDKLDPEDINHPSLAKD